MPSRKFGVEIEFITTKTQAEIIEALEEVGLRAVSESYNHTVRRWWKLTTDSSIRDFTDGYTRGFELVSPPLLGEQGITEIGKALAALRRLECSVNKTCGFHVHVDANDLNTLSLANIVRRYVANESLIDSMVPEHRRMNDYALSSRQDLVRIEQYIAEQRGMADAHALCTIPGRGAHDGRYRKINLHAYSRYGTVEFRQHSGTLDIVKVANWVTFCIQFVEDSIIRQTPMPIVSESSQTTNTQTNVQVARQPQPVVANNQPQLAVERRNSRMRHVRKLLEMLISTCPNYLNAQRISETLGIRADSVPVYISLLRSMCPTLSITTRRNRGYLLLSSTNLANSELQRLRATSSVPATANPVTAQPPANIAQSNLPEEIWNIANIQWQPHTASIRRPARNVLESNPPGIFDNLPFHVRQYFQERIADLS